MTQAGVARAAEVVRPASFAQEREWFLDQMEPGSSAYNVPVAVHLRGNVDTAILERSLGLLAQRHDALRTRIEAVGGRPLQVVAARGEFPLHATDVRHVPAPDLEALVAAEAAAGFDLAKGPLVRARLLRLADDDHLLVVVIHHIVVDAWSVEVLLRELGACYDALSDGRPPNLVHKPLEYADFACHQRRVLEGERLHVELEYWRGVLGGARATPGIPTDFPRPPRQTSSGDVVDVVWPTSFGDRLHALARSFRATPFVVVTAVWKAVLARLTGDDRIVVGTYVANRSLPGTENVVGFFVNTVALYTDLGGDPRLGELIGRVRRTVLGALSHAEVPFERVLEAIRPQRDPQRTPLFQTRVEVLDPVPPPRLQGITAEIVDWESRRAEFDLELSVRLQPQVLCRLKYNADLFTAATAKVLLRHFAAALEAAAADPSVRISGLPLAGPTPRTRTQGVARATLDRVFDRQVAATPDAPAIDGTVEMSYADLQDRARAIAWAVRSAGVRPEDVVGVLAERGPSAVTALFGILAAGGAYLPLDPRNPQQRIEFMVRDARAAAVVADPHLRDRLPPDVPVIPLVTAEADATAAPSASPDNLAYVIYTSGSTGRPKGVGISHANVLPVLEWSRDHLGIGPGTRTLQHLSPSFDFGLYEVLLTCLYGGCLVVAAPAPLDPDALAVCVRENHVTALHATPSQIAPVAAAGVALEGLQLLHLGGEELTQDLVEAIEAIVPSGCRILNGYGPTENSVNSTLFEVTRGTSRSRGRAIPIGSPTAATTALVLNAALTAVPACGRGELWVGGPGVARGYVGNPRLTAERFLPDPFGRGERLYRTGDLVRRTPDDQLEFLGRVDEQVKIRGFRVEPGEIRTALIRHPQVDDAAVLAVPGASGSARLVAYVVAPRLADIRELRAVVAGILPDYMVPSGFVTIDDIPLTPNGKVDLSALPAAPVAVHPAFSPPRTAAEEAVARIWADVLGVDRVGRDDDFFDLGGHSLAATTIVARVRQALDVDLPLRALFEAPTVAGIVDRMVPRGHTAADSRPALR